MADERDEIRSRIDLVELVGQKVALKRAGKNWKGLCPFHDDRNPSFYVSPDIGYYRCWSCGEKGDAFTWVMKTQNMEFREALELLAKQAGVTLKSFAGESSKGESEARAAAMEEALKFFRQEFPKSPVARKYCEGRGIPDAVIEKWELGYAPDVGEALAVHLQKKGHNLALCQTLFLVDRDAGGGYYDRFRGRLMFPIRDERGQLVAFGGRLLGDGNPKYVNSGDTPIYRKSRVLYGLFQAKQKLLASRRAVLVEGYLDVIACHQAGVEEAVASLGTSLAEDHGRLLKRWCDHATVLYDADEAGKKAAERACEILRVAGLDTKVALVPPGDDPDTLLRREGPLAVKRAADGGISPLEFTLRRLEARLDPDLHNAEFWTEASAAMAACPSPADVDRHVSELAAKFMKGQTEAGARSTIYAMIKNQRRAQRVPGMKAAVRTAPVQLLMSLPEAAVFRALLDEGLRNAAYQALQEEGLFRSEMADRLRSAICRAFPEAVPAGPAKEWIGEIEVEELRLLLADIQFFAGHQAGGKLVEDLSSSDSLQQAILILRRQREESLVAAISKESPSDPVLESILERLGSVKGWHRYEEGSDPVDNRPTGGTHRTARMLPEAIMTPVRTALLNKIVLLLALAGIVVAGTLAYTTFLNIIVPCGVGDGCKDVANHPSSRWFGIPVSLFGVVAYLSIALLSAFRMVRGMESTRKIGWMGYGIALIGAIISIGLQVYSGLEIHAWCSWCIASAVIMVLLFIIHAALSQSEAGEPVESGSQTEAPRKSDMPFLIAASVIGLVAVVASAKIAESKGYTGAKFVGKATDVPLLIPPDANSIGPVDAPITIVEFGDLCCSACHRAYALVKDVMKAHEGKIRLVFRHFPLLRVHKHTYRAAVFAEFAAEDGKFWKFLDAVYSTNPEEVDDPTNLQNLLLGAGIDVAKADAAFENQNSPAYDRVYRDFSLANNLGIKSTPTFFLVVKGDRPFSMAIGDLVRLLDSDPKYRKLLGKP